MITKLFQRNNTFLQNNKNSLCTVRFKLVRHLYGARLYRFWYSATVYKTGGGKYTIYKKFKKWEKPR